MTTTTEEYRNPVEAAFNALIAAICSEQDAAEGRRQVAKDLAGLLSSNTYSWIEGDEHTGFPTI